MGAGCLGHHSISSQIPQPSAAVQLHKGDPEQGHLITEDLDEDHNIIGDHSKVYWH